MKTSTLSKDVAADQHAIKASTAPREARWRSVEEAAAFLGMPPRVLREALASHARAVHGAIEAHWGGILARKLGRRWRVWLSDQWTAPQPVAREGATGGRSAPAGSTTRGGKALADGPR